MEHVLKAYNIPAYLRMLGGHWTYNRDRIFDMNNRDRLPTNERVATDRE
jgi:hypothetical protein